MSSTIPLTKSVTANNMRSVTPFSELISQFEHIMQREFTSRKCITNLRPRRYLPIALTSVNKRCHMDLFRAFRCYESSYSFIYAQYITWDTRFPLFRGCSPAQPRRQGIPTPVYVRATGVDGIITKAARNHCCLRNVRWIYVGGEV